jgi:hypothetical protein
MQSGARPHRFTLERLNAPAGTWAAITNPRVWAAVEALGEGRFRLTIEPRADLRTREDLAPAMRATPDTGYPGGVLALDDVQEITPRETTLIASRLLVESEDLRAGVRRVHPHP